jgi:recombination protein RecA
MSAQKRQPIKKTKPKKEAEKSTPSTDDEDDELINSIILDLNKKEPETAMILDSSVRAQVQGWIPSGDPAIDEVLGGGWPLGRIVEVFGPESNGKTTVALHAVKEVQDMGGVAIFLDNEHALSKERAKDIGVNLKKLIYVQPGTMEEVFESVEGIIEKITKKNSERPILIVWDSVAASPAKAEVEGDYDDQHVGIHARIMSQSLRKINKLINHSKACFMCINQTRDKVGVMYGEKSGTPGGRALKFYASIRLEVVKIGQYKEGSAVAGIKCIATAKKNKVAPPFGKADFNILFAKDSAGIDGVGTLLDKGLDLGIFGDSKGWYELDGTKYRKADARKFLKDNPSEYRKFYDTITGAVE